MLRHFKLTNARTITLNRVAVLTYYYKHVKSLTHPVTTAFVIFVCVTVY